MEDDESLMDTVKTLFYAIVIAILIRTFLFEPFKIPSGSMYPTLYVGDYLFVSKYTYGYSKHSLPFSMPLFEGRVWADEPNRGDVVVFKFPQDNRTDYIKRVIGLPGDRIKLENGRLYVNGELVERAEIEDFVIRDSKGNAERYHQYVETLPDGVKHKILEVSDSENEDNVPELTVPQGYYFVIIVTVQMTAALMSVLSLLKTWSAKPVSFSFLIMRTGCGISLGAGLRRYVGNVYSTR